MFVFCFEAVVWKRSVIVMVSRVVIPAVVCVSAAFFRAVWRTNMVIVL